MNVANYSTRVIRPTADICPSSSNRMSLSSSVTMLRSLCRTTPTPDTRSPSLTAHFPHHDLPYKTRYRSQARLQNGWSLLQTTSVVSHLDRFTVDSSRLLFGKFQFFILNRMTTRFSFLKPSENSLKLCTVQIVVGASSVVSRVLTPSTPVYGYRRFGGTCYTHLQSQIVGIRIQVQTASQHRTLTLN